MSGFVSLSDLIPILQLAIGPVILISGMGLILLSMTNRFGRVIDRSRLLSQSLHTAPESDRASILKQLRILAKRARIIRSGIAFGVSSVLLVALLVISLFVGALLQLSIAPLIVLLFVLCLVCLIVSLLLFLADINVSLKALWLEIPKDARFPGGKH
jgi:hypothetical protein